MKILVVSSGKVNRYHRVRLYHILKALGENKITLLYSNKPKWKSYLDCCIGLFGCDPLEICYCKDSDLRDRVAKIYRNYDLILVKRLRSVSYIPKDVNIPVIVDSTDAMSLYYQLAKGGVKFFKKPLYLEEWIKYRWYEKNISKRFDNWVVCSDSDAEYLRDLCPNLNVWVVPNVVDTSYYSVKTETCEPNTILFSGLMDKHVNLSAIYYFLEEIFDGIRAEVGGVKLEIAGPNPPSRLKNYGDGSVNVLGQVKDIREAISRASVVVVPVLMGTGTSNKILQAWSMSKAVVSTSVGARGLGVQSGEKLIIADDAEKFALAVIDILKNPDMRVKMGKVGRRYVKKEFSLDVMRRKYNKVILEVLEKKL